MFEYPEKTLKNQKTSILAMDQEHHFLLKNTEVIDFRENLNLSDVQSFSLSIEVSYYDVEMKNRHNHNATLHFTKSTIKNDIIFKLVEVENNYIGVEKKED